MNWYKLTKIIDKNIEYPESNKSMHVTCQYCNRWATHPTEDVTSSDKFEWKTFNELNPEEKKPNTKCHERQSSYISFSMQLLLGHTRVIKF